VVLDLVDIFNIFVRTVDLCSGSPIEDREEEK
jgi:hypothetical protein